MGSFTLLFKRWNLSGATTCGLYECEICWVRQFWISGSLRSWYPRTANRIE